MRRLRAAGHVAYFAGGCVRDELLGRPATDYDVATEATPDRIRALFRRTAEVGASFGVMLVRVGGEALEAPANAAGLPEATGAAVTTGIPTPDDAEHQEDSESTTRSVVVPKSKKDAARSAVAPVTIEVATFRSEGPYSDRRRPDAVHFADAPADARRRDFTINALFLDPLAADPAAAVIDYVGGLADLRAGVVRAVGDPEHRLAEDHLRALRAVRIAARLGFTIDPATADAIRRHTRDLLGVSRERIGEEVRRMLIDPSRAAAVRLLQGLGLDAPVLREANSTAEPRLLACLPAALDADTAYPTALAAWLLDRAGAPAVLPVAEVVRRCRAAVQLSNEQSDSLAMILRIFLTLRSGWMSLGVAGQKRLIASGKKPGDESAVGPWLAAVELLAAESAAAAEAIRGRVAVLAATGPGLWPPPLITGDDLIAAGFRPGPSFKSALERVYDKQLEGRITSPAEAMELARRLGV